MLIALKLKVVGSNIEGKVVDETKSTLLIETEKGIKRVIKDGNRFIINMDSKEIKVNGNDVKMRPWEYAL